jgi:hypothetical protein
LRRLVIVVALLASGLAAGAVENLAAGAVEKEKPAENMLDVQAHFARCFRPPQGAKALQGTFHFSLNRDGGIIGEPRIAWFKFEGSEKNRTLIEARSVEALKRCAPVPLSKDMARVTPGKVHFFRFMVGAGKSGGAEMNIGPY